MTPTRGHILSHKQTETIYYIPFIIFPNFIIICYYHTIQSKSNEKFDLGRALYVLTVSFLINRSQSTRIFGYGNAEL